MHAPNPQPDLRGAVLLVDDTPMNLDVLVSALTDAGYDVFVATDGAEALERARRTQPDLVLLDVMMPGVDGFETCRRMKADPQLSPIPVMFMTALSETVDKVRGFEAGGVDYITKPIQHEEVLARVDAHLTIRRLQRELEAANADLEEKVRARTQELEALQERLQLENSYLREEVKQSSHRGEMVGDSEAVKRLVATIDQVAETSASVLILGESGVGKELVAREIHGRSARWDGPMVKVNCASVPRELFESEFFGHVKGAFTGAVRDRVGRFELAHGGTLFLDELGEIPLELQSKLLRVLQEREFERVGDPDTRSADVRVVAATNRDLRREVEAGRFREDLFYRLSVFPIEVPPLRFRREDIAPLARHFLEVTRRDTRRPPLELDDAALDALCAYDWPGNIRELQNVIERAAILSAGPRLRVDLALHHTADPPRLAESAPDEPGFLTQAQLEALERDNILRVLERTQWRVSGRGGAAELLGVKPTTLQSRMKSMGIRRPR